MVFERSLTLLTHATKTPLECKRDCDVNSNTNARTQVQPESHTVQIAALLMRSRLEIAKASQRERALLQMQTIVDDLRGNVVVVVEENSKTSQTEYASTRQRFRNFHGTPLRPLWEIRKELGGYYLGTSREFYTIVLPERIHFTKHTLRTQVREWSRQQAQYSNRSSSGTRLCLV